MVKIEAAYTAASVFFANELHEAILRSPGSGKLHESVTRIMIDGLAEVFRGKLHFFQFAVFDGVTPSLP